MSQEKKKPLARIKDDIGEGVQRLEKAGFDRIDIIVLISGLIYLSISNLFGFNIFYFAVFLLIYITVNAFQKANKNNTFAEHREEKTK